MPHPLTLLANMLTTRQLAASEFKGLRPKTRDSALGCVYLITVYLCYVAVVFTFGGEGKS